MKRPDQFFCGDSANLNMLAKDIEMIKRNLSYERYWNEVAKRIMDTPWWNSPEPENKMELEA
jgi:hypothetical protein